MAKKFSELLEDTATRASMGLMVSDSVPIISMDDWGVHPSNSAATNQVAIANLIAKIKNSSQVNRFHLRLNRAGTFNIQKGASGAFLTRYAAILLPSNCTFELSKDSVFRMPLEQLSYILRNDDPINGNHNIRVIGGQWDGNATTGDGILEESVVPGQGYYGNIMWWENVQDLHVEGCVYRNPNLWAMCGTKLNRATFQAIYMDDVHRDGLHLCGECYDCNVFDYAGETHDNSLAISTAQNPAQNTGDYFFGNFNWADGTFIHGDMKRIRIHRPYFINSNGPIAIFGRVEDTIEDIHIANVTGTTATESAYAIAITQYVDAGENPTVKNVVIENVKVTTKPSEVAVFLSGTNTKSVTVRDVTANGAGVIAVGTGYDSLVLENIRAAGSEHAIQLGNDDTGKAFHSKAVQIGNLTYSPTSGSRSSLIIQANATFDNLTVENVNCVSDAAVTWQGIKAAGTTRKKITVKNCNFGPGGERCFSGPLDVTYDTIQYGHGTGMAWLAVDGAKLIGDKLNYLGLGASGVGYGSSAAQSKRIVPYLVNYTDIATAGGSLVLAMPKLPRGAILTGASIKSNTAFSGGTLTAVTMRVRWLDTAAAAVNITGEINVTPVTVDPLVWGEASNLAYFMNATVDWQLLVLSYGGNLNECMQGQAVVFLEYFVACTSQQ